MIRLWHLYQQWMLVFNCVLWWWVDTVVGLVVSHVRSHFIFPKWQIRCCRDVNVEKINCLSFWATQWAPMWACHACYMLPYVCIIVSSHCGYNRILTLKVNLNKTLLRTNQKGVCVMAWDPKSQRCSGWRPGTSERSPVHLLDYWENKWTENVTVHCCHGNIPLGLPAFNC